MRGALRTLARPLADPAGRRRAAHVLLGGAVAVVLALPLVAALEVAPLALLTPLALLVAGRSAAVRSLERAQAEALLGTPLPTGADAPDGRVAAWLVVRAVLGGTGAAALALGAAAAALSLAAPFEAGFFATGSWSSPGGLAAAWLPVAGLALLLAAAHLADALARLQAALAPRLLGPSPAEEVALLRARTDALAERERIARELHDSVGHAVTVTLLQARAATKVLDRDPAAARTALAAIEDVSRTTMDELDRVLALLRQEGGSDEPGDLEALAASLRAAGLPLTLAVGTGGATLPVPVRAAAFRVVQEAATNVLRHAGPVATRADVERRDGALVVRVRNTPGGRPPATDPSGSGRGLAGVRERARALGGDAHAGPTADGGWLVEATLPLPPP